MSTGDLKNNVLSLQQAIKSIKFKGTFDMFGY